LNNSMLGSSVELNHQPSELSLGDYSTNK
jgi:hypothetical protein